MAWVYSSRLRCYTGESGVAKPTVAIDRDTLAYEYDTGDVYIYDSATWRLKETGSALPTGAATSAKQDSIIALLSNAAKPQATQTRPANATTYAAGDVVGQDAAANMTFADVIATAAGQFIITSVTLEIDVAAVPSGMAGFRLHLFDAAPTAITDNLAFNLIAADRAKYIGPIVLNAPSDLGDTLWSQTDNINLSGKLAAASTTIYGVLETLGAYTPTSAAVKTITIYTTPM